MQVTRIDIFPVVNGGMLKARAHVTLKSTQGDHEICAKGFRIHIKDGGEPWVGPPSESYVSKGKKNYKDIMWLNQAASNLIYSAIIKKFKEENKT